jgi:hypothetical protein
MKQVVFLVTILLMTAPAWAQDWEGDLLGIKGDLHASVGVTWDSKYLWRGFDIYDDKSAVHLRTDIDLFETGFGLSVMGHRANSGGFEDKERWDFAPYYQNSLFKDQRYVTQFRVGWVYYTYPELNEGQSLDMQEAHLILSWPEILPVKGLCPTYELVKLWQSDSESRLADGNGWLHILMLDYGLSIPSLVPGKSDEQIVRLHSEVVFNDGWSPTPARRVNDWRFVYPNPDHDWSHAVFGASTDFNFGYGITFTPAIYHQTTMDKSVNEDKNETWASLTLKWSF